jgi:hypothetical protein
MRTIAFLLVVIAGLAAPGAMHSAAAQDVTIYRCVDAKGHLTLRDTPCGKNEKQESRTITRPRDAAPRPVTPVQSVDRAPVAEATRQNVTYLAPPRPLYECITPDGMRYTSETSDGNPRYVPLWPLGYPVYTIPGSRMSAGITYTDRNVAIGTGTQIISPSYISPAAYGAGTYVRDTCYMLPQADVCARTRDRRDELRKRFFNAMPSERDVLRVEERTLTARLEADCNGD